jgi:RimJ/RimL family protein N-acetyltransferase
LIALFCLLTYVSPTFLQAAASFLVYVFGIILETARRHTESFKGIEVDRSTGRIFRRGSSKNNDRNLPRTFTPADVVSLIQDNLPRLQKEFPGYFKNPKPTLQSLEMMQQRIDASGVKGKPLTLEEYDDRQYVGVLWYRYQSFLLI